MLTASCEVELDTRGVTGWGFANLDRNPHFQSGQNGSTAKIARNESFEYLKISSCRSLCDIMTRNKCRHGTSTDVVDMYVSFKNANGNWSIKILFVLLLVKGIEALKISA